MDIVFRSSALAKACNDQRKGMRKFGEQRFKILRRRLDQFHAADTLADVPPAHVVMN